MNARNPADLEAALADLAAPVRLLFFTQTFGCDTCVPARRIVDRVASLSEHITVEEFNLVLDKDAVRAWGIRRAPAIAVVGEADTGIRFYGVPEGHELISLVDAVLLVASRESGLSDESRARLAEVDEPLDIQVFVTPT
jgi:alkyl hydroperoxide reductase subunit AhpF